MFIFIISRANAVAGNHKVLKDFPTLQGRDILFSPMPNLSEKHFTLRNRIVFVTRYSECVTTITHVKMPTPGFRGFKAEFLQLFYKISSFTCRHLAMGDCRINGSRHSLVQINPAHHW